MNNKSLRFLTIGLVVLTAAVAYGMKMTAPQRHKKTKEAKALIVQIKTNDTPDRVQKVKDIISDFKNIGDSNMVAQLQSQLQQARHEFAQTQTTLAESQLKGVKMYAAGTASDLATKERELAHRNAQLDDTLNNLKASEAERKDLHSQLETLNRDLQRFTDIARRQDDALKNQEQQFSTEREDYRAQIQTATARLNEAIKARQDSQNDLKHAEKGLSEQRTKIQELKDQRGTATNQIVAFKGNFNKLLKSMKDRTIPVNQKLEDHFNAFTEAMLSGDLAKFRKATAAIEKDIQQTDPIHVAPPSRRDTLIRPTSPEPVDEEIGAIVGS